MHEPALHIATEPDGTPIRLARHCRHCGALLFSGYLADGVDWRVEFFASADAAAEPIEQCPTCEVRLLVRGAVATAGEMDARIAAQRDRFFAGTWELDAEAVAVLLAQEERGTAFEDLAREVAHTPEELRAALSAWLAAQPPPKPEPAEEPDEMPV